MYNDLLIPTTVIKKDTDKKVDYLQIWEIFYFLI